MISILAAGLMRWNQSRCKYISPVVSYLYSLSISILLWNFDETAGFLKEDQHTGIHHFMRTSLVQISLVRILLVRISLLQCFKTFIFGLCNFWLILFH